MKPYADTSFLVPLFIRESTSVAAIEEADRLEEPLPLIFLNSIEFINALNARVFRQEITSRIRGAAFAKFQEYLDQDVFVREAVDPEEVRQRAEELSNRYTPRHGARSLDLLHIAAAQFIECRRILTFDERQRVIAKKEGLAVAPEDAK